MDVPKELFAADAVKIMQEIAESHFIAFDLEFSGVAGRSNRAGKPTLQEYYEEVKQAAEKYQVLQIGLSIAREDVKTAIGFLLKHRFDFGQQIAHGVPYLSRFEESETRRNMRGFETARRPDMTWKPEDDALLNHIRTTCRMWLKQPRASRESYFNIPSENRGKHVPGTLNRYQIRLTHQTVLNEFPGLETTSMTNFVSVRQPTDEEKKKQEIFVEQAIDREVSRAIGFRWLLEAIVGGDIRSVPEDYLIAGIPSDFRASGTTTSAQAFITDLDQRLRERPRVLVGHNCFTDLVNLHKFIKGSLPQSVTEFAAGTRELFTAIIDTKHLASFGSARWGDTSLAKVEEDLQVQSTPIVQLPQSFDRYNDNISQHEAGYDSLLTARIAIKLSAKMHREGDHLTEAAQSDYRSTGTAIFGKEEGYANTMESRHEASDIPELGEDLQTPVPVRTVSSTCGVKQAQASIFDRNAHRIHPTPVVAVKERESKLKSHVQVTDVIKVQSAFSSPTMWDILGADDQNESSDQQSDLTSSGGEFFQSDLELENRTKEMVEYGQLIPRWDSEFWQTFGNVLQVNGCKEGVCILW